ncbi:hypothetical protein BEH94_03870 [Candidatus Altiarchaeales archaeon WOR_SM1_SCG]|nr:hypothetical protein BEH94_03870 [Candidatus Altiarchaeales archaeon WOR_SM1_SCG]
MANAYITVDEFKTLKKRIDKLESWRDTSDFKVVRDKVYSIEKENATLEGKIDGLRDLTNERFNSVNARIDSMKTELISEIKSLDKRINMQWALQIMTFLAILGLYFKIFGVI